ncbi:MAG: Fic family protein [Candidatus Methanomethylophilaceae archaeon]|nr:Fic family protein [Candidatus Methanomethylophilaceae archaeon]
MKVDPDILNRALNIENINGRTQTGLKDVSSVSEALVNNAILMSVRDSNAIEGIGTTADRVAGLVNGSIMPRGHDENEMVGYSEALRYIHRNYSEITLSKQFVLDLYAMLMSRSERNEPGFKTRDNVIVDRGPDGNVSKVYPTVPAKDAEYCMDQLICSYWEARNDMDISSLLLIPCFIMDFLRIHPFSDDNGRMSRLLTTLLLYQEGYDVCRYISMESKINHSKMDYYKALEESQIGWFDNECDYSPFIHYFLGELFLCYRDLNRMLGEELGRKRKAGGIEVFLRLVSVPVSKSDLMAMYPDISKITVERTLKRMCDSGFIEKIGSGKSTRYVSRSKRIRARASGGAVMRSAKAMC